ncbi:hypothetical protein ONS95_007044 [Cadophora gregata]|uniref:uncharacterized protein n=1 Tax=Cadophora gregata TaxID=51156 RepID=UPI0026DA7A01|nr:uncharacterized protein ONS95_007044 [Cadophora gregata]KAK0100586.1 hypothetical protein ONS95_007044 [Cadophora gregata]
MAEPTPTPITPTPKTPWWKRQLANLKLKLKTKNAQKEKEKQRLIPPSASPSSSLSPFPAFSATDVTLSPLLTPTTQLTPTSNGTNAQAMTRKPVPQSPGNREVSQTSQEAKPNVDTHNPKNENQEEDWELTSSSSSRTNNVDDMPNERVPQIEISIPVLAPEPEPERVPGAGSELDPQRKSSAKSSAKTSTRESV